MPSAELVATFIPPVIFIPLCSYAECYWLSVEIQIYVGVLLADYQKYIANVVFFWFLSSRIHTYVSNIFFRDLLPKERSAIWLFVSSMG